MPYRSLPDSDPTRSQALSAALKKSAAVAPEDRLVTPATAAALTDYESELACQSAAKDALDGVQQDVNAFRPAADQLIKDLWDEVEFALRQLDPPSLRRRAREWGVTSALRPGEPEEPAAPAPPAP